MRIIKSRLSGLLSVKESAFIVVLLALIPFGTAAQDSPLKPDGRMWQAMSNSGSQSLFVKTAYVQGVISGLQTGAFIGYLSGRTEEKQNTLDYLRSCLDKGLCGGDPVKPETFSSIASEAMAGATKFVGTLMPPQHVSLLDIVRQTDKFYADYKNTPVCMIQAVQESISSLRGTAMSEQELELVRKGCTP
jgi:hypothetical protein